MKQVKILLLIVIILLPLVLVSCAPWGSQSAGGWAGTMIYDGIIYAGTRDGRVVAVNSSTGNLEWDYPILVTAPSGGFSCGETSAPTAIYSTPVVDEGIVYVGTYSGRVFALNTSARSQDFDSLQQRYGEWKWPVDDSAPSSPIVADLLLSGNNIYVSSSNGGVYSLDKRSGDENRKREEDIPVLANKLWTSPAILDSTLYVSTYDGHIYALSIDDEGQLSSSNWSFESGAGFASSPVIYKDAIFVGSFDRYLYAINIGSDVPMWKFPEEEPAGNWFWASPVVSEDIVYAGCLDGLVYAIQAKTGEELWEFDAGSPIVASPVLMDNLLIVINESGTVYVFDLRAEPGNETVPMKTISIDAAVKSPFCTEGGLVYILGEDNWIYAVDIDVGGVIWSLNLAIEE